MFVCRHHRHSNPRSFPFTRLMVNRPPCDGDAQGPFQLAKMELLRMIVYISYIYICLYICVYIYTVYILYICVCVCVCFFNKYVLQVDHALCHKPKTHSLVPFNRDPMIR